MKFFIPGAKDAAQSEEIYEGIRKFNAGEQNAKLSPRRIYRVRGVHNSEPFTATVGEPFEKPPETVVAILLDESRTLYYICTHKRGVARGIPYLSGSNEIQGIDVEDFEP
jgi:hypothetical protein